MRATVRSSADLGRALVSLRTHRDLSQQQLADTLGVDRTYIAKIEHGHSSPLLDLLLDAIAELGATVTLELREADHG